MVYLSHSSAVVRPRTLRGLEALPLGEIHRTGRTGKGMRVGLADSGVGRGVSDRVEGELGPLHGHGTLMAELILAVAPEATLVSAVADRDPTKAVRTLGKSDCDVILCAWWVFERPSLAECLATLSTPVIAPKHPDRTVLPGSYPGVLSVDPTVHRWPTGPVSSRYRCAISQGTSISHALFAGAAALWLADHREKTALPFEILFSETLFRQLGSAS